MICPLCNKFLLDVGIPEEKSYICATRIKFEGKASLSHYENRHGEGIVWYAAPYQIKFKDGKSIISVLDTDKSMVGSRFMRPVFKHIFTAATELHPDDPEKIAKRIKNLIMFS